LCSVPLSNSQSNLMCRRAEALEFSRDSETDDTTQQAFRPATDLGKDLRDSINARGCAPDSCLSRHCRAVPIGKRICVIARSGERPRQVGLELGSVTIQVWLLVLVIDGVVYGRQDDEAILSAGRRSLSIGVGARERLALGELSEGRTYELVVALEGGRLRLQDRVRVELTGARTDFLTKELHAGDPDFYLPYRPSRDGPATLVLARAEDSSSPSLVVSVEFRQLMLPGPDRAAIEAEPNDSWKEANELRIGRDIYGSADDVDYLENRNEGKSGHDWFRFEVAEAKPVLVYFQLDLLDRDVSANLRVNTVDAKSGLVAPYHNGKDPMEIVHDRERERYSKHISRTFSSGTYFLEVNANHPDYILRTRLLPVPPYQDPAQAVEAGMHYLINAGDAWFAQIPREGNIYVRADNLHDTATRCTACHASSFTTEANLVAHRNGYPIRSKANFQYLIDRLYNSITPLYGDEELYWQRFIGIPLQAQGKQGGILLDFERQVSGQHTKIVERFGPFLSLAWQERGDLPADEVNGVVPSDSKFGFGWRDWRVLGELGRRTGRVDYGRATARIAKIFGDKATDGRVETLQDRIHRLYGWWLIDKTKFAESIRRETEILLTHQNPDGGWHEVDSSPGPSAVYTSGQLTWTLLQIGLKREHPAIVRALGYLLAQQKDFGGWFQTTTHENFRTPMRETRYAVMALAEAFPTPKAPLSGWGNRDDQPALLPRMDSLVHTLDDLENLWQVPESDRPRFTRAIIPLLTRPEAVVRALAAACLGRVGNAESVAPLLERLDDPSKIVWRTAAWSLRRLGNRGIGIEKINTALKDSNPRKRRGATRIFAYQFHGMDTRVELADRLIELTRDPDLWTRLQAIRTLRQWFYRTNDAALQRRIIDTYLAKMAVPDTRVMRENLSQGLYIMLDENLGGAVSLQQTIAQLPDAIQPRILEARRVVDRDVLLTPILLALGRGNDLQRAAVLKGFDGSFFKGRSYARQPRGMIDVGNDREFGFLYEPELEALEATFAVLLSSDLAAEPRRQALQLASFFRVPSQSRQSSIQLAVLRRLRDPDAAVCAAARTIVSSELDLSGAEDDPKCIALILHLLEGNELDRQAVMEAIGRNEQFAVRAEILAAIRRLIAQEKVSPSLIPVLSWPVIHDDEVTAVVPRVWPDLTQPQRLQALDVLLRRPALVDVAEPHEAVMRLLRRASTDPSASVRQRTLRGVVGLTNLWAAKNSTPLVLSALADDASSLRRMGLTLASSRPGFWSRPDALEYLKRLLIDPDTDVRIAALSTVKDHRLIREAPALASRIKVLVSDPALGGRARRILEEQGFIPASVEPDVRLGSRRLLNFSTFRRKVNPIFYRAGDDGYACANCHANHTILRIAEAEPAGELSGEQLMINYNSALKVVNLGEPEHSLILRKPRSPQGQGGPDPSGPTGYTHVGGPRWANAEHPAYRAILEWIHETAGEPSEHGVIDRFSADNYAPGYAPEKAGDCDLSTIWHTEFVGATPGYPHELVVDLGSQRQVEGLLYVPRQDMSTGRVKEFEVRTSGDGKAWSEALASGSWADDPTFKHVDLPLTMARYVQLRGLSEVNDQPFMSAAEVSVETARSSDQVRTKVP
jgi:cellulose synthase operon protein C